MRLQMGPARSLLRGGARSHSRAAIARGRLRSSCRMRSPPQLLPHLWTGR